jgi:Ca-activated chloride channel family protein
LVEHGTEAIAQLWGRAQIKDLMNQMVSGDTKMGVEAITSTALTYQLLSQYTAFVAVSDEARVNPQEQSVSVQVPVEMPEGVSHIGVFGNAVPGAAFPVMAQAVMAPPAAAPAEFQSVSAESADRSSTKPIAPQQHKRRKARKFSEELFIEPTSVSPSSAPAPQAPDSRTNHTKRRGKLWFLFRPKRQKMILSSQTVANSSEHLQIVSLVGLERGQIRLLNQHLQSLQVPTGFSGDLVFEFQVAKGRINQLVLDEQASTLQEGTVIEAIRRSLLTWKPELSIQGTVRLTLRIRS